MHCLIAGAGVFGVSAAIELAERGHQVSLLDPGPLPHPDAASTDISKVIRMDYGANVFYTELMERALRGWRAYNEAWPAPLFHEHGVCVLSSKPLAPGTFEGDSFAVLTGRGHALERLAAHRVTERFPAWREGRYVDGYFNPQGGFAESGRVVAALVARARDLGVDVRESARVERVHELEAAVDGVVLGDGTTVRADVVLVAAGAWTPVLLPHLAALLKPVGQPVFHFQPADTALFSSPRMVTWTADVKTTGWYGFAANSQGVVKIANHGTGVPVDPRAPRQVPVGAEQRFRAFLRDALPALADAPLAGQRLCLYCDTPDGNFLIDRDPERPGLVVATGDSGHAFKFAPVLGGIIADVVEGKDNAYAQRFAWRDVASSSGGAESARCQE
jgi:sarcosine oxidase